MSATPVQSISGRTIYDGYAYSYPHKTTYRRLDPPAALDELWAAENRDALFLYIHIPFCRSRCGYCNLLAAPNPDDEIIGRYLTALTGQARRVRECLGDASFTRLAVGGGTPSCLNANQLTELFGVITNVMGADLRAAPTSFEASPTTLTPELMDVLSSVGVDRLSVGVQSFSQRECKTLQRMQSPQDVRRGLQLARRADPPTLNIDLMYGVPGQSSASWLASIRQALDYEPQELYLYPLYTRPLTPMFPQGPQSDSVRLKAYRNARSLLLEAGYEQMSMRMFKTPDRTDAEGPAYSCQNDGMIGLGCGPRSYTRELHYSVPMLSNDRASGISWRGISPQVMNLSASRTTGYGWNGKISEEDM